jgi:hypothetical protein
MLRDCQILLRSVARSYAQLNLWHLPALQSSSMSPLGQSRRFDLAPLTSGLPRLEKQTSSEPVATSQKCQWATLHAWPYLEEAMNRGGLPWRFG